MYFHFGLVTANRTENMMMQLLKPEHFHSPRNTYIRMAKNNNMPLSCLMHSQFIFISILIPSVCLCVCVCRSIDLFMLFRWQLAIWSLQKANSFGHKCIMILDTESRKTERMSKKQLRKSNFKSTSFSAGKAIYSRSDYEKQNKTHQTKKKRETTITASVCPCDDVFNRQQESHKVSMYLAQKWTKFSHFRESVRSF